MDAHKFQSHAETYMDSAGLSNMLSEIAEVCLQKADHVKTNWQDVDLAKRWLNAHSAIEALAAKIDDPLAP